MRFVNPVRLGEEAERHRSPGAEICFTRDFCLCHLRCRDLPSDEQKPRALPAGVGILGGC